MSTTTTAYEVLGTSDEHTQCQSCGRDDLRGTIALAVVSVTVLGNGNEEWAHTGEVVYFGSDCGARAAGYGRGGAAKMRKEAASADYAAAAHAEMVAERKAGYTEALVFFQSGEDGEHPQLLRARQTFHRSGGLDALGPFPAWLAGVAETGILV